MTMVSAEGGAAYFWNFTLSTQPSSPSQPAIGAWSGWVPTTCTTLMRPALFATSASSSSFRRMSSGLLLPYSSVTSVESSAWPASSCRAWYMGAIPVPPAIMVMVFLPKGYWALMLNGMCLKPTFAPISRPSRYLLTVPCS